MVKYVLRRLLGRSPPLVLLITFVSLYVWMIALASSTTMWWVGVDA